MAIKYLFDIYNKSYCFVYKISITITQMGLYFYQLRVTHSDILWQHTRNYFIPWMLGNTLADCKLEVVMWLIFTEDLVIL